MNNINRKKVVEGLEWILEDDRFGLGVNWETGEPRDDYEKAGKIITDTITLLKEQEPQLVLNIGEQISCKSGSCPNCGKMLNTTSNKKFCGDCGQEVKWE